MNLKAVLLVLALATVTSFGAVAPQEFADIKWGASFEEATRIVEGKSGKFVKKTKEGGADALWFDGGNFAGRPVEAWVLFFEGNAFNGARVRFAPDGRGEEQYRKIKSAISEKYGTAADKQVATRRPGHFVLGLGWRQSGADKAPLSAKWVATSNLDKTTVEIRCWLDGGRVRVQYGFETAESVPAATPAGSAKGF